MKSSHRSSSNSKVSSPKLLLKLIEQSIASVSKPSHTSLTEFKAMTIVAQPLSTRDPDVYEPFDDPKNPTFGPDHRVTEGVLRLDNFAPSAYKDIMFIPLRSLHGDCTGLRDISEDAFSISLGQLIAYYSDHRDQYFPNGIRIYLNGGVAGRQSVRRFHWRAIGSGPGGGDLGPYRTLDNAEVATLDQFPADFTVQSSADSWQVVSYPTPHANVDILLVPPTDLWQGGLETLAQSPGDMRGLCLTLRRLMANNPMHFAWGYRFLILAGPNARQSQIPGLPFECRLLAGGIAPGNPLPIPRYDDLGRYSIVPGLPDEDKRTELVRLLNERAKQIGKRFVPSYWGEELRKIKVLAAALS